MLKYDELDENIVSVLAGCHSLTHVEKKLTGDPIETLFFDHNNWEFNSQEKTAHDKNR